jgi:hypothetical protein
MDTISTDNKWLNDNTLITQLDSTTINLGLKEGTLKYKLDKRSGKVTIIFD